MKLKLTFIMLFLLTCTLTAFSQVTIKGVIVDKDSQEPLIGVSIYSDTDKKGTVTDLEGGFTLNLAKEGVNLKISYIGYIDQELPAKLDMGTIGMTTSTVGLKDVVVTSSIAIRRKTPVALSVVEPEMIEAKLSTQEFPEILNTTPSIYATKQGGGYGDSRVNMRGFENENIAVMINGIPMNDMEWGGIYWSNWAGLSDVTRSMQVQRGLGAAKVSAPSVGGLINIVTRTTDQKKGGSVSYGMGNDGYNRVDFSLSTGLTDNGWAATILMSKKWGDGYIQGTDFDSYTYFANISKQIQDNHQISLTAFGSPQSHYQRKDDMLIEEWQKQSEKYRYNAAYGFDMNGQRKKGIGFNKYHKPQISLNHTWNINEKSSLSSTAYVSLGYGYGLTGQGYDKDWRYKWYGTSTSGRPNTDFVRADGTIASIRNADDSFNYGLIYEENQNSANGSLMATARSINNHQWYGLMSTYTTQINKYFDVYGGIDLRYYKGIHQAKIDDLYGGEYFIDSTDRRGQQKLKVGDIVYRNYNGYVTEYGVFGQGEYNKDALSVFIAGSINSKSYWREELFALEKNGKKKSSTESFIGYTVKTGANYNIDEHHNVFANIGYISRAPFYSGGVFLQAETSNELNKDAENEKVFSFELGYGFKSSIFSADLNVYRTMWMDKTMTKSMTLQGSEERAKINLTGVDAIHQGVELEFTVRPIKDLTLKGMFSFNDWRWNSNTSGYLYDSQGSPLGWDSKKNVAFKVDQVGGEDHALTSVNLKDVKVGNSAQTTFAFDANYRVLKDIRLGLTYKYYARNYADYALRGQDLVIGESNPYGSPWRIPSAGELDVNASWKFKFAGIDATLYGNINNVLNNIRIADASDGSKHSAQDAQVYYAFGRTYSIRVKVNF